MLKNYSTNFSLGKILYFSKIIFARSVIKIIFDWKLIALSIIYQTLLSGCTVFFPAHPNSGDTEDENIIVTKLNTLLAYKNNNKHQSPQIFENKQRRKLNYSIIQCLQKKDEWDSCVEHIDTDILEEEGLTVETLVATEVIKLAIDAAADAIKDEGSKHEANFGKQGIEKNFWVKDNEPQSECIDKNTKVKSLEHCSASFDFLRIVRTTQRSTDKNPAFELVLYFEEANKDYFVYPIRYITRFAKAKVLDPWCNPFAYDNGIEGLGCAVGYIPPLIAVKFFQDSDSSIQTNALISMTGHWRTPDQKSHSDNINNIQFTVSDYKIDSPDMKFFDQAYLKNNVEKNEMDLGAPIAWTNGMPVSQDKDGTITSNGIYTLEVKVSEIDRSKANVDKMAKRISGGISDNKEKITSAIVEKVSGDSKMK